VVLIWRRHTSRIGSRRAARKQASAAAEALCGTSRRRDLLALWSTRFRTLLKRLWNRSLQLTLGGNGRSFMCRGTLASSGRSIEYITYLPYTGPLSGQKINATEAGHAPNVPGGCKSTFGRSKLVCLRRQKRVPDSPGRGDLAARKVARRYPANALSRHPRCRWSAGIRTPPIGRQRNIA